MGPGRLMGMGDRRLGLSQSLTETLPIPPTATVDDGLILTPGLRGWWDASTLSDLISNELQPVSDCLSGVARIRNKLTGGADLLPYAYGNPSNLPRARGHLSGSFGGVGTVVSSIGMLAPSLDPDIGFSAPDLALGADANWTIFLVWSRPNERQGSGQDSAPVSLISCEGRSILQARRTTEGRQLVLFPEYAPRIVNADLARRHTHSIVIRHSPVEGVDVWLDDEQVVTGAVNPLPVGANRILLLHDGTPMGAAQCWFHEAAAWAASISDSDITTLLQHAGRWHRGPRLGLYLVFNGQSNAINYSLSDGAASLLADGVAWHLGALACNVLATTGDSSSFTMRSGHGIYAVAGGGYPGSFLSDPHDGTQPDLWSFGQDGLAVAEAISSLPPEDRNEICAFVWPWNETDSLRGGGELATFTAAAGRFLELERTLVGKPAAQLPLIWWSAIPYGTDDGMAMHRRAVGSLAADASQNVIIGNPQTADTNPRGSIWDETSGTTTSGDPAHRDSEDNRRLARLAAPVVARALLSAGYMDSMNSLPDDIPIIGGPRIIHAYRQTDTDIVITVLHDVGDDLVVPRKAATGQGFAITDGVPSSGAGRVVLATACSRLGPTQLLITLSSSLMNNSANCALHYPYGGASIGRGNAVTDNYSSRPRPPGWEIEAQLGSAWRLDFPLASTLVPIAVSDVAY